MFEQMIIDNIVPVCTVLFTGGGIYYILQFRVNQQEQKINEHDDRIIKLEKRDNDIIGIKTDINWIKEILSEIKKKFDNV